MVEQDPYQAPETDATNHDAEILLPSAISSVPKVFGILHIIYAVIGGLVGLGNIATPYFIKAALGPSVHDVIGAGKDTDTLNTLIDRYIMISTVDGTIRIILAIVLLIAGIHLLQKKAYGVKFTKLWAITRMFVAAPLVYLTTIANAEVTNLIAQSNSGVAATLGGNGVGIGFGIVLLCIYPLVSVIMLSHQTVKNSLTK